MSAAEATTGAATAMAPAASRTRNGERSSFTCFLHPLAGFRAPQAVNLRPPQGRLLGCYFKCWPLTQITGRGVGEPAQSSPLAPHLEWSWRQATPPMSSFYVTMMTDK